MNELFNSFLTLCMCVYVCAYVFLCVMWALLTCDREVVERVG